jgi:hypothetical protein
MPHQKSPYGTVGDHAGRFRIWLHCSCGHAKQFEPEDLVERLGADFPNRLLVARARCERCGDTGAGMTIEPIGAHGYATTSR